MVWWFCIFCPKKVLLLSFVSDFSHLLLTVISSTVCISYINAIQRVCLYFPLFPESLAMHLPDWTLSAGGVSTAQETSTRATGSSWRNGDLQNLKDRSLAIIMYINGRSMTGNVDLYVKDNEFFILKLKEKVPTYIHVRVA